MNGQGTFTVDQLKKALVEVSNICIMNGCNARCPFHNGANCPMFDAVTPAEWDIEEWVPETEID